MYLYLVHRLAPVNMLQEDAKQTVCYYLENAVALCLAFNCTCVRYLEVTITTMVMIIVSLQRSDHTMMVMTCVGWIAPPL